MRHVTTPMDVWANTVQASLVVAEANAVISMRMLGMFGFWSVTPSENGRMISEKAYAATKAVTDASRLALQGARPDQIAAAAIKPIRQKTRANTRRLAKRGPKVG